MQVTIYQHTYDQCWYRDMIGKTFDVVEAADTSEWALTDGSGRNLMKSDCQEGVIACSESASPNAASQTDGMPTVSANPFLSSVAYLAS